MKPDESPIVLTHSAAWVTGAGQHPPSDLQDQAGLLGDGDELERGDQAALGMLPAHESLDPHRLARVDGHHRLVGDRELVAEKGLVQRRLDLEALGGPGGEGLVEHLDPGPPALLGVVHGRIGLPQHVVRDRPRATRRRRPTLAETKHSTPSRTKGRSNAVRSRQA